jgi:hypothetical protein
MNGSLPSRRRALLSARPILSLLVLLLCAPAGAAAPDTPEARAGAAAIAWLHRVDAADYAGSWKAASKVFRDKIPQAQWQSAAASARSSLGALVSRTLESATVTHTLPGAPDGDYVVLKYASVFEHKASATETLAPRRDEDGTWRVAGYYIR